MFNPLLLVGAAAALLFAFRGDKKPVIQEPTKEPVLPPGGVEPGEFPPGEFPPGGTFPGGVEPELFTECFDDNLPPDMRTEVDKHLRFLVDPNALDIAAGALAAAGFPVAAACLKRKADDLRASPGLPGQPKPLEPPQFPSFAAAPVPFTVRSGDFPFALASYYTGQGTKFKELEPLNPQMGPLQTIGGVSNYKNWQIGLEILLPVSWKAATRPYPTPGTTTPSAEFPPPGLGGVA